MPAESAPINLTHHFLIAMPGWKMNLFPQRGVLVRTQRARRARPDHQQAHGAEPEGLLHKIDLPWGGI
jgi:putative transcriptional regulator